MSAGRRRVVVAVASGAEASMSVSGTVPKLLSGAGVGLALAFAAGVIVALGLVLRGADLARTAGKEEEGTSEQS